MHPRRTFRLGRSGRRLPARNPQSEGRRKLCRVGRPSRQWRAPSAASGPTTFAFVLLNDAQALRAAAMPREVARILDHLGSLESGAGFTDLLDFSISTSLARGWGIGARPGPRRRAPNRGAKDNEVPFGPRGVSLPAEADLGLPRPRLSDGLIADIIAALIRALGAPPPAPATDGDAPDLDEGDAADAPSSDDLARNLDASGRTGNRLATAGEACRKRLSVMLKRLEVRLDEATAADPSAELGARPPGRRSIVTPSAAGTSAADSRRHQWARAAHQPGEHRPDGRRLSLAVRALYGPGKLALRLETAPSTRASEERQLDSTISCLVRPGNRRRLLRQPHERVDANTFRRAPTWDR